MTFDLFELPPVKYDVYIRRFGRSNTKQVFVQTEYGHDEEIQTDEINSREKWTQIPPNDQHGFGGDLEEENSKNVTWNSRLKTDAIYLNKFVQNVGQMILHVLEEELADVNLQKLSENYTNINFSQGFIQTGSLSLLAESPITYLSFSNIKTNFLLSVHSTSINQIPNSVLNEKGIICIWNINQPLKPERILTSNGQPSCCCFGPENIDIVIAGMIDGSIALWDLQEEASSHPQIVLDEKEWSIRTPTYNTATVLREEGHHSCVVAIKTLPYSSSGDVSSPSKKKLNSIRNFHVISLEDLSVIHIWIAMEIAKQEVSSLEGDLGLAPWGKVKLIKSSSIKLYNLHGLGDVMKFGFRSFDFQIVPSNSSHMLITTDTGAVIHCTRFNSKIIPRLYISNSELLIEARCIDISPHDLPLFMVGCNDGSIRLHDIKLERPLLSWSDSTNGKPVKQIKWSPSQPSVFFVMDADSRIYIWDLSQNISSPVEICELSQNGISCLCFSCDAEVNKKAYSGWPPHLAMARENGILEIHQLGKKFSTLSPQQYEKQKQVLLNL
ncbi:WD repeat-containing protein 60-like isoform X1 [Centruroides sculpturatus]|uniref:WD repeat-containing protein 60-like isoform X1 n=2 Tax=Centruroides sculpturatus TaxID=218467 RepID=UPI000C6DCD4D|nr:WD repeat-containing protein 60-like isoform X1 [Centruroides sculpturatus]